MPLNSVLCGSNEAAIFVLCWHDAIVPNNILPFVDGETTGDVALLEDNIAVEESGVLDGPGCGLGKDVPEYNVKCRMMRRVCRVTTRYNRYRTRRLI